jgi:hypothetical protein
MRTKTLVEGFKNSQKFRFILTSQSGEEFGMYITVDQMNTMFATGNARAAVWDAMIHLSYLRRVAEATRKEIPTGLGRSCFGYKQVQVTLM